LRRRAAPARLGGGRRQRRLDGGAGAARPRAQRGRGRVPLRERAQLSRRGRRRRTRPQLDRAGAQPSHRRRRRGAAARPRTAVAHAAVLDAPQRGLVQRVTVGMGNGKLAGQAAAITKLFTATSAERKTEIRLTLAGTDAVTWPAGEETLGREAGESFLERQAT